MKKLVVFIGLMMVPAITSAQVDDARLQQARARFEAGETAYAERRYESALEAFEGAHEMMRGHANQGMILFNIARVHEELGHPREAREAYRRFLADAPADAPNRTVALERIAVLDDEAPGTTSSTNGSTTATRSQGHWINWVIAGALVAVAAPAIAVPLWTVATEGECLQSDADGCMERVQFGAIDGVGLGLGIAALIGAISFAAGQPIQTDVQISDEGAFIGVRGVF